MHYHQHSHTEYSQSAQDGEVGDTLTPVHELHDSPAFQQSDDSHGGSRKHWTRKGWNEINNLRIEEVRVMLQFRPTLLCALRVRFCEKIMLQELVIVDLR